jgi:hypothetical protein
MELATNTITADSRIGSHHVWIGTIWIMVPLLVVRMEKLNANAPQPTPERTESQCI